MFRTFVLALFCLLQVLILKPPRCSTEARIICILPSNSTYKDEGKSNTDITGNEDNGHENTMPPESCDDYYQLDAFSPNVSTPSVDSNTVVAFMNGLHQLSFTWKLMDLQNITLTGTNTTSIHCITQGGILLQNITDLQILGLSFENCSSQMLYIPAVAQQIELNISSTLAIIYGSNVIIKHVNIRNTISVGICVLNVAGDMEIMSLLVSGAFSNNDLQGGNLIVYDFGKGEKAFVRVTNSNFTLSGYSKKFRCLRSNSLSLSSGLSVFLNGDGVKISISNTSFFNNSGCNGGNLLLYLYIMDHILDLPPVILRNVSFVGGKASIGGGFYISFEYANATVSNTNNSLRKAIQISNCTFEGNYASLDGGGIYIQWSERHNLAIIYEAEIVDTVFVGNQLGLNGSGGLALHCKNYRQSLGLEIRKALFSVNIHIRNCTFKNHSLTENSDDLKSESSVILAKSCPYLHFDRVHLISNNNTAILGIQSVFLFNGTSTISQNRAVNGAAIRLCSESVIYLEPHTNLLITDNGAVSTGGGIFVSPKCLTTKPACFYQFTPEVIEHRGSLLHTINVTVANNTAGVAGNNLYGGSLDYCYLYSIRSNNKLYQNLLNITPNSYDKSSISSDPQQVCFWDNTIRNNKCTKSKAITVYPGSRILLSIRVVGQLKGNVPGVVTAIFRGSAAVCKSDINRDIAKDIKTYNYTIYSVNKNMSADSIQFKVDVERYKSLNEYTQRFKPAVLHVDFKECPLGLKLKEVSTDKNNYECVYEDFKFAAKNCVLKNGPQMQVALLTKSPYSWIGTRSIDNVTHLIGVKYCPLNYCLSNVTEIPIYGNRTMEQDLQCDYNRTGFLCGSCSETASLVFGSPRCSQECANWTLFLVIPFMLAGLLLVFVISYLNLTVSIGTLNGLIFYANIMQDNLTLSLSKHQIPYLTRLLQVFLAWMNFDLGIHSCFYKGMGAFGKTALSAVFPLYLWFIAFVIIVLSNRYITVTRLVGENAVKVLATLILLSYSKMLKVTINSLNYKEIVMLSSNDTKPVITWLMDGNVSYLSPYHFTLVVLAIVFVIFSLPFTLALLCVKHIFSLSNYCKCFSIIDKLKPFFDAYTGPFKDRARFWPGLLLVARIVLLVSQAIDLKEFVLPYYVNIITCFVLSAAMISLNGVYKNRFLDLLEYSFMFNIGVVFTSMIVFESADPLHIWRKAVNHIFLSIAFFTFLGIVGYHVYLKCSGWTFLTNFVRRKKMTRQTSEYDVGICDGMRGYERVSDSANGDDEKDFVETSDRLVHFPPVDCNYNYN